MNRAADIRRAALRTPLARITRDIQQRVYSIRREPELRLIDLLLNEERTFVDVGANVGLYSLRAEHRTAKVVACEPHPLLAQQLRRVLRPSTTLLEVAIGETAGALELYVPTLPNGKTYLSRTSAHLTANPGAVSNSLRVPVLRLDDLEIPESSVIKVDVEGHELAVLRGATSTLARGMHALIIESEIRHDVDGPRKMDALLRQANYQGYAICPPGIVPLHDELWRRLQDPGMIERVLAGEETPLAYSNNFLYLGNGCTADEVALALTHTTERWSYGRSEKRFKTWRAGEASR